MKKSEDETIMRHEAVHFIQGMWENVPSFILKVFVCKINTDYGSGDCKDCPLYNGGKAMQAD